MLKSLTLHGRQVKENYNCFSDEILSETKTAGNQYVHETDRATDKLHHLSMWHVSQAAKISFAQSRLRVLSSIIYPLERKELEQTAS